MARGDLAALTHLGVLVEASALVRRRFGLTALRSLHDDLLAPVEVVWIDEVLHGRAVSALLAAGRRHVSLVDWTFFEPMRERAVSSALAFDRDFADQGLDLFR